MDSNSTQSIQKQLPLASVLQPEDTAGTKLNDDRSHPTSAVSTSLLPETSLKGWYIAFKNILPTYFIIHLVFFIITCLSVLFSIKDFSSQHLNISTLWQSWLHWDTYNFIAVAVNGYSVSWLTAFFPLFPLLERCLMFLVHDPLIAGLIVSNLSGLGMLIVLYRVVQEDFDDKVASRTVLYFSVFPAAFFFAAIYSESLFLFLALLSFYQMRHSRWWLAGIFGALTALTRSTGLFLILPFCYEYLRQHDFKLKNIRFDIASGLCIIAGTGLFALYCYYLFHDPLAFSHAETRWDRKLSVPGYAILRTVHAIIISPGGLSFQSLRNILDLIPDLFMVVLVILSFVGPWKFQRSLWVYAIFAATFFIFAQLFPFAGLYPLQSTTRYLLSVFPAFIVLAAIGKNRTLDVGYLLISGSMLFFLLTQFLTNHWII
jgi:Mannosyltransferase (PIG-V)